MSQTVRAETRVSDRAAAIDGLPDDVRFRILRLLEANPNISQRELAEELGISVGRINYCVRALVDKGFVKLQNFRSSTNKLRYAYLLTPAGISARAAMTADFLRRKLAEFERLRQEIDGLMSELGDRPDPVPGRGVAGLEDRRHSGRGPA
jgi:EPS-associated MarR family transcriptional regulator